jgi:hypothetical protein
VPVPDIPPVSLGKIETLNFIKMAGSENEIQT